MNKHVCPLLVLLLITAQAVFALELKELHEHAGVITLEEALQQANDKPQSLERLYVLALKYLSLYKTDEAEQVFREMLEIDLSSIEGRWGVVECRRRRHMCDTCREFLDQAIASHPDFYPAYISAAYLSYMNRDFAAAAGYTSGIIRLGQEKVDLTNYVRALSLHGGSKGMLAHYGGPLAKIIHGGGVFSSLEKAERVQPDAAAALLGLGAYYLLAPPFLGRDLEKAEEYLLKAAAADPLFADVYVRLAQLYRAKGDAAKYEQYLEKALELDPGNEMAIDVKSRACNFICP